MCNKILSDWLLDGIKAAHPISKITRMVDTFLKNLVFFLISSHSLSTYTLSLFLFHLFLPQKFNHPLKTTLYNSIPSSGLFLSILFSFKSILFHLFSIQNGFLIPFTFLLLFYHVSFFIHFISLIISLKIIISL